MHLEKKIRYSLFKYNTKNSIIEISIIENNIVYIVQELHTFYNPYPN